MPLLQNYFDLRRALCRMLATLRSDLHSHWQIAEEPSSTSSVPEGQVVVRAMAIAPRSSQSMMLLMEVAVVPIQPEVILKWETRQYLAKAEKGSQAMAPVELRKPTEAEQ